MRIDFTQGNVERKLWAFSIPMLVSVMFQQIYNIADSMIAGRFAGEDALAAVGASYPITMLFIAVAMGSNIGCSVVISQAFGARDYVRMKTAVTTTYIACAVLSVVLSVAGFLTSGPLLRMIQTPENIFADGQLYLNIYIGGVTFLFLYNICTGIFNAGLSASGYLAPENVTTAPEMTSAFQKVIENGDGTFSIIFNQPESVRTVLILFFDGIGIAWMERHSNHRADLVQFHMYQAVIISHFSRIQLLILLASAMDGIKIFNSVVCLPDGREAGSLCGHNVHTDPKICAQVIHARSHKLHYFVLHIAICKNGSDDGKCHILRAYAGNRFSCHVNTHYLGTFNVISSSQKLLYKLRSPFSHSHGSKSAITGMAVRSQDHLAALSQHFSGKLMDNCLMRWNVNTPVAFCTGQSKHMVILVDSSPYCTQRVMTVGQYVRNREFLQP